MTATDDQWYDGLEEGDRVPLIDEVPSEYRLQKVLPENGIDGDLLIASTDYSHMGSHPAWIEVDQRVICPECGTLNLTRTQELNA
ncbi:hypothetical protein [Halomarina oriensis]|uniref:Uncharacterized protein n=1 Tax=Halomarina oriensis TaxID=671145 RepID=A0A6B0GN69_9EURY|nr:hypothetical protein [Halomarina oriensis]MWG36224.1 hypothetical protein [Halomarina oriensis]